MDGRSKDVAVIVGGADDAKAMAERYRCKYLCGSCGQLRMPNPGEWPTSCSNWSHNIDRETDFENHRLELTRLKGDPIALARLIAELENVPDGRTALERLGIKS